MKLEKDREVAIQGHEDNCMLWIIPFENRTLDSCSCCKKDIYQQQFFEMRISKRNKSE